MQSKCELSSKNADRCNVLLMYTHGLNKSAKRKSSQSSSGCVLGWKSMDVEMVLCSIRIWYFYLDLVLCLG